MCAVIIPKILLTERTPKMQVDAFFAYVTKMAEHYRTPNLILTMGEDFHYQNADMWYKNLDKLIK